MTRFLVDNSVIQRYFRQLTVRQALADLDESGAVLCTSTVSALEAGYSARSQDSHRQVLDLWLRGLTYLPLTPEICDISIELQTALWRAGMGRSAGAMDLLHAACGVASDAVILHYDADYDNLAHVDPRVRVRWVVDRGSIA